MPRLLEAMKDVTSCDKPRGEANTHHIRGFPNGATHRKRLRYHTEYGANPGN